MVYIKFHGTKNRHRHVRNFSLLWIFHELTRISSTSFLPLTFDKDVVRWYNAVKPWKVTNWDDLYKKFLKQYSYNTIFLITLKDLGWLMQEEKEGFTDYLARWRVEVAHIVGRSFQIDQVRLFIRSHQPSYYQHLRFTPFESFIALRNLDMLVEEELSKEVSAKTGNKWRNNHQNKDKEASSPKEVHAVNRITEYTSMRTTYT